MNKIAIVGVEWDVVDLIESISTLKLIGFIDFSSHSKIYDLPYLGKDEEFERIRQSTPHLKVALAMDRYKDRARLSQYYGEAAHLIIRSNEAYVSPRAEIGIGTLIQRGARVMPQARVGQFCKINVGAAVHHESIVGDFCTLAPGSQVLGRVVVEEGAYIGAGAIIRQDCRVGKGAVVGAGAVVVKDVPPETTVVGVPAKELTKLGL